MRPSRYTRPIVVVPPVVAALYVFHRDTVVAIRIDYLFRNPDFPMRVWREESWEIHIIRKIYTKNIIRRLEVIDLEFVRGFVVEGPEQPVPACVYELGQVVCKPCQRRLWHYIKVFRSCFVLKVEKTVVPKGHQRQGGEAQILQLDRI